MLLLRIPAAGWLLMARHGSHRFVHTGYVVEARRTEEDRPGGIAAAPADLVLYQ